MEVGQGCSETLDGFCDEPNHQREWRLQQKLWKRHAQKDHPPVEEAVKLRDIVQRHDQLEPKQAAH